MRLKTVRAVYKENTLIFEDEALVPQDGTEVVVTYAEEERARDISAQQALHALRGRGKGENLVEQLLESRRKDREQDGATHGNLHS